MGSCPSSNLLSGFTICHEARYESPLNPRPSYLKIALTGHPDNMVVVVSGVVVVVVEVVVVIVGLVVSVVLVVVVGVVVVAVGVGVVEDGVAVVMA
mgnify:CR=1 FL=1